MAGWECGSCGALTDRAIAEPGDLYHDPDEDCRAVRPIPADTAAPDPDPEHRTDED